MNENTTIQPSAVEPKEEADKTEELPQEESVPSIKDDLDLLKKLDPIKESCLKIQLGKHPNKDIDALLERSFKLSDNDFHGNIVLRILITESAIFFIGIIIWGIFWISFTLMELRGLAATSSWLIGILTTSAMAIAIFQPYPVIDEEKLRTHIKQEIKNIKKGIEEENKEAKNDIEQSNEQKNDSK